ncbi:MAG: benzoate/H(+) symporter BenE family transporter [Pseudomonadota bacterium]
MTSRSGPPLQTVMTGLVVAIVGFFSSFPIVLQGLKGVGASPVQAASGLMMAAIAMGVAGIALSLWQRQPISVAWSTPGAALLAVTGTIADGFAGAVAGFLIAGVLTVITGAWRPVGRLAAAIPAPLAQAMLAGVLVALCIVPFRAMAEVPWNAVPVVATWFVVGRVSKLAAVPAAVIAAALVTAIDAEFRFDLAVPVISAPEIIVPVLSLEAILSIALPLWIVTMATQNIPGVAIIGSYGYAPPAGPLFASVGGASVVTAPFGAPATCLAAITAAMCANEDSHPDPARRYWSAVFAGVFYCVFGLLAGVIAALAALAPDMVLGTLAGVALIGVFSGSVFAALQDPDYREAAAITFLVTASGITVIGLGAAVWGLALGGLVQAAKAWRSG